MHELGLCDAIVHAVAARAGVRPVAKVTVRVGRLHHVHPDAFEQSFAIAATGTVADGAMPTLVLVPVAATCQACGHQWQSDSLPPACPSCGAWELEVSGGDELTLQSIEYRG